ncbi:MAG TPA: DegT/DnrJ/EryC1/StrS family aminotransferase [Firmicutes bacterium]|nr:DegT/DnrJ/EryC1/StrS family aminotransferase [Bacillota bacterium]
MRKIPIAKPFYNERIEEAVVNVLRSGRLVCGPVVAEFERLLADYIGARHVVAVSSGTAALHLALLANGIQPGDEVITTPFTFASSVNAIIYCGGIPVFADIDPETYNIDPDRIEERITPRTVGIEAVHLYGHPAEMDAINEIAQRHGLWVVEDAAQGIGAEYRGRKVGSAGNLTCFSTYCTKNLHSGEGGFIACHEDSMAEKLRMMRNIGQDGKYNHVMLGYNYRMTEIQAAIGREQVPLIEEFTRNRRNNARRLNEALRAIDGITTPYEASYVRHAYHQYAILVDETKLGFNRDELARRLSRHGIETAVHYPVPVYAQPYFRERFGRSLTPAQGYPITERVCSRILSLPVHPALSDEDMDYMVEVLHNVMA